MSVFYSLSFLDLPVRSESRGAQESSLQKGREGKGEEKGEGERKGREGSERKEREGTTITYTAWFGQKNKHADQ
jgi:hypothetical protein